MVRVERVFAPLFLFLWGRFQASGKEALMAAGGGIAARVQALCAPVAEELGVELLEVKYVKEGPRRFLRLIIDKKGGIGIDDCEAVSRAVDPLIDENIEIKEAYYLEVQSPGLDRPLKTQADFLRYAGQEAEVKFYRARDGQKTLQGLIDRADEEHLYLKVGESVEALPLAEIAHVKRVIRF